MTVVRALAFVLLLGLAGCAALGAAPYRVIDMRDGEGRHVHTVMAL